MFINRKLLIFSVLTVLIIFTTKLVFYTKGTSLDFSFPTSVSVGQTVFAGQLEGASRICIYNAYEDCGNFCSVTERQILLEIRRLDNNKIVRIFYNKIGDQAKNGTDKSSYFYFKSTCKDKGKFEPFRLSVQKATERSTYNEVLIGLE